MNTTKTLQDKIRTAEVTNDLYYAALALEEHFSSSDVDLWWFTKRLDDLQEFSERYKEVLALMGVAGVSDLSGLESIVISGLKNNEQELEKAEELRQIKQELAQLYARLLGSLT